MIFHQAIRLTGVPNQTAADTGIESTEKAPKRLISILAQVSNEDRTDMDNDLEGWIEKTRVFDIPVELIDTSDTCDADTQPISAQRINEIPVEADLAVGEVFKVAVRSGAKISSLIGAYVYEIKTS